MRSLKTAQSWQRGVPDPSAASQSTDWRFHGRCADADPELFFPSHVSRRQATRAKAVCSRCPVQVECLEWALATRQPDGVWGGLDEKERAALRHTREI